MKHPRRAIRANWGKFESNHHLPRLVMRYASSLTHLCLRSSWNQLPTHSRIVGSAASTNARDHSFWAFSVFDGQLPSSHRQTFLIHSGADLPGCSRARSGSSASDDSTTLAVRPPLAMPPIPPLEHPSPTPRTDRSRAVIPQAQENLAWSHLPAQHSGSPAYRQCQKRHSPSFVMFHTRPPDRHASGEDIARSLPSRDRSNLPASVA
jgi:hypothetical protein